MTQVGHSLTGIAIAVIALPMKSSHRRWALTLLAFVVLANIPDLRLPNWGHERYDISHSIFVNLAFILLLSIPLIFSAQLRCRIGGVMVGVGCAAAWMSHLLLDTFYNHGRGIALFWPFSQGRLALPIPWFETVKMPLPHFDVHSARVWAIELMAYGTILGVVVLLRYVHSRKH